MENTMRIDVVISGRSYHLAEAIPRELTLAESSTLDDAIAEIASKTPKEARLPDSCLVAVSGKHQGSLGKHQNPTLRDGDELVIVAPVSGG